MLQFFTGPIGSAKSYHAVSNIIFHLKLGGSVVTNFELDIKNILKYHSNLTQKDLDERLFILPLERITPDFLYNFSLSHKDNLLPFLLVIDDSNNLFCSQNLFTSMRSEWLKFFIFHRSLRYICTFVCHDIKKFDKELQFLFDSYVFHMHSVFPNLFVYARFSLPSNAKLHRQFFLLKKKYSNCLVSYMLS